MLTIGAFLAGCSGSKYEGEDDAPNAATQPAEEALGRESPRSVDNVANAVAADIDESSIYASLVCLSGAYPAPLESDEVTISERGSEGGRRAAAQYMEEFLKRWTSPRTFWSSPTAAGAGTTWRLPYKEQWAISICR
jgi:hypothetical protein